MHPGAPLQPLAHALADLSAFLPLMHGMSTDSRQIEPGMAFAAYPGEAGDGRDWIADAIARGASCVLWDPQGWTGRSDWPVPALAIPALKTQISRLAAGVYGDPSRSMRVIGVTGTNGKTSCTHWIAQALSAAGKKCALIGTLGSGFAGALQPTGFTTPGPVELQAQLAALHSDGASHVAMEVSSHGLAQGRVDGVHFDLAVFTNLSRDHLDYHGDMESYGRAKAALFHAHGLRRAIINLDDAFGAGLHLALDRAGVPVTGYTQGGPMSGALPTLRAVRPRFTPEGTSFLLESPAGRIPLEVRLLGAFNLSNLLAVLAVLLEQGVAPGSLPGLVQALVPPPGRLERMGHPGGVQVVIDYAHTPDALEKILQALRPGVPDGRLICVFGCGGDRDPGKRPQMGRIAEVGADLVILTNDNPRSEDPAAILAAIRAGMHAAPALVEPDRRAAIAAAIAMATPADMVVLAGKGHERYQEIAGQRLPFSDIQVVRDCLGLEGGQP